MQKKAKEKGISLSKLIEEGLDDTYHSDKDHILDLISRKKGKKPAYWKELNKSPIAREFEDYIATLFTEFVNPISKDVKHQPVVLLMWLDHILKTTIKHFDSIPEEHKLSAAQSFMRVGKTLVDGLTHLKSKNTATQDEIIKMEKDFIEKAIFYFTSLALAKESYSKIRTELEKVNKELIAELKLEKIKETKFSKEQANGG